MPVKKGLVEENVSTKVLAALSTAFGREISFVDDLTYDEYETELREAMLKVHPDRGGDEETFKILSAERDRIRKGDSEIVPKEKKTSISGAKLLPGTTFRPDDIKPADVDKDSSESSTVNIADRLNNIADALGVIGGLFKLELKALQDKETQDLKDKAEQDKKAREAELEAKKGTKPKKDSKLKIPKLGFFDTLKKFFLNVAAGAATLKLVEWFKNPANRDKILAFTNFLKDNAKAIFITLAALVALDFGLKLLGIIATLKGIGALLLSPKFLALMILIGGAFAREDFRNKEFRLHPKVLEQKIKEREAELGRPLTTQEIEDIAVSKGVDLGLGGNRDLIAGGQLLPSPGSGVGYAGELYFGSLLANQTMKLWNHLFGKKNEFAEGGRPPVGEVVSVGERGRELFVADTSGTIIPNDKSEHVFDGGALLVAKSNTMDKVSGISQRVSKKKTPNLIDLRGGKGSSSNPTFNTGDQISSVSSEDSSNIDIFTGSLSYGLVG